MEQQNSTHVCEVCNKPIEYVFGYWRHKEDSSVKLGGHWAWPKGWHHPDAKPLIQPAPEGSPVAWW